MKTRFAVLFITLMVIAWGVNAQEIDIKGTWKMVSTVKKGELTTMPEGYTMIKLITPTHFSWSLDIYGNIIDGCSGSYTLEKDIYIEHITKVLPGMRNFLEKRGVYKITMQGKRMEITGYLNSDIEVTEVWEKID